MSGAPFTERRKVHPPMTRLFRCYLKWWPSLIFFYYLVVAYFPPAAFSNSFAVNLYSWMAWASAFFALLSFVFPYRLNFKAAMCAFAIARWMGAIGATLYERELLQQLDIFWARLFLLNASLALTLLWVGLYAVTIPYMKELQHEHDHR